MKGTLRRCSGIVLVCTSFSGCTDMSTFVLLTITGIGLAAMYFLIASGLSLIYGLMGLLNFAQGSFLTVGAYGTWWMEVHLTGVHSIWRRYVRGALCELSP